MYLPSHFEESREEVLHALVRSHPLCTLITQSAQGLLANHIPMLLRKVAGQPPCLVGHVARANAVWHSSTPGAEVLAVFQGPQLYISPAWYPSKQEHGKVVPTWNYAVVHAHGVLQVHEEPEWIRAQVHELTQQQEQPRASPWSVDDAPRDYTDKLLQALVGIEIRVTRWVGKWKVSQNQPAQNRAGVVAGLSALPGEAAASMAALVGREA